MEDKGFFAIMQTRLILHGALAILENEGLSISGILRKHGQGEEADAYDAALFALYWLRGELEETIAPALRETE